jgi:uncharacterized protein YukE
MAEKEELIAVIRAEIGDLKAKMQQGQQAIKKVGEETKATNKTMGDNVGTVKRMGAGLFALAGLSIGLSGAVKGVNTVLKSTQGSGDALTNTLRGLKEMTTQLSQAMATGDFSNFGKRLKEAYQAGIQYSEALDEIADRMRAVRVRTSEYKAEMLSIYTDLYDKENKSLEERGKLLERYKQLNEELLNSQQENNRLLMEAERKRLITTKQVTSEQADLLINYVKEYDKLTENELVNVRKVEEARQNLAKTTTETNDRQLQSFSRFGAATGQASNQEKKNLEVLAQTYRESLSLLNDKELAYFNLGSAINRLVDAERDNIAQALINITDAEAEYTQLNQKLTRHARGLSNERRDALEEERKKWLEVLKAVEEVNKNMEGSLQGIMDRRAGQLSYKSIMRFDTEEGDIFDPIEQEAVKHAEFMRDWASNLSNSIHALLVDSLIDSFDMLGTALGAALTGKDFGMDNVLLMFADWGKKLGAILVAAGLALFNFQTQIIGNPLAVAGFGAALIAASAAVKAAVSSNPATGVNSSYGGTQSGGTIEGLRDWSGMKVTVSGVLIGEGSTLKGVLDSENDRLNL